MQGIDRHSYSNQLRSVHPVEKTLFSLSTVLVCLVVNSILTSSLIILVVSLAITYYAEIPPGFYLRTLLVPLSFLTLATLTVVVTVTGQGDGAANFLWGFNLGNLWLGFGADRLLLGLKLFLKSFGTIAALYFLILTTPVVEIISVLKKCRVPKLFLELMSLIYHLLFVLSRTASEIKNSQLARLGYSSPSNTMNSLGRLGAGVFVRSYHRARKLITALEARGYDGELTVVRRDYEYSKANFVKIGLLEIIFVLVSIYTG